MQPVSQMNEQSEVHLGNSLLNRLVDSLSQDFIYPRNLMVAGAGFEPATFGL